jgi:hypothetical protein
MYVGFLGWKVGILLDRGLLDRDLPLIAAWAVAGVLQILW